MRIDSNSVSGTDILNGEHLSIVLHCEENCVFSSTGGSKTYERKMWCSATNTSNGVVRDYCTAITMQGHEISSAYRSRIPTGEPTRYYLVLERIDDKGVLQETRILSVDDDYYFRQLDIWAHAVAKADGSSI